MENSAYLNMLLLEREPGFLATLELAMSRVEHDLSGDCPETVQS